MTLLNPCPFCKGEVQISRLGSRTYIDHVKADTPRCLLFDVEVGGIDEDLLVARWNRRDGQ